MNYNILLINGQEKTARMKSQRDVSEFFIVSCYTLHVVHRMNTLYDKSTFNQTRMELDKYIVLRHIIVAKQG